MPMASIINSLDKIEKPSMNEKETEKAREEEAQKDPLVKFNQRNKLFLIK